MDIALARQLVSFADSRSLWRPPDELDEFSLRAVQHPQRSRFRGTGTHCAASLPDRIRRPGKRLDPDQPLRVGPTEKVADC